MDEISSITARISEIQSRISALTPPSIALTPTPPPAVPAFAQALSAAQANSPATMPQMSLPRTSEVAAPPASLGPLPVSPGAPNVVPIASTAPSDYETLIQKYAAQNNVQPSLVRAVIQTESGSNPRSVSSAGAMGLMQLMPENVKEAGVTDPFDPEQNIAAGTKQLSGLLSLYHGDLDLALAGYNAGPGNVRKYGGVPPFTETRNYIQRVKAAMSK